MRRGMLTTMVAATGAALLLATAPTATAAKNGYTDYHVGNADDVVVDREDMPGGTLLSGGGIDDDQAMHWLLERGGATKDRKVDVVVLDAWGKDIYSQPFMTWGADSVDTFVVTSRTGAADPTVIEAINHAEVIWLDGGDQSKYLALWGDTPLSSAVHARVEAGAAFGGMSAGLAVQGDWIYSAERGSATSAAVLANPYDKDVTLSTTLFELPLMANTITDTHFKVRDRMGRLLGFLARLETEFGAVEPRAIAVDEDTSLGLDREGKVTVFGVGGGAWLVRTDDVDGKDAITGSIVAPKTALTYGPVGVTHLSTGETFDLAAWNRDDEYALSAVVGVLSLPNPY